MCIRGSSYGSISNWFKEAISWHGEVGLSRVSTELDRKLVVDNIVDNSTNQCEPPVEFF